MSGAVSNQERRASVRYPCDPESFSEENSCRPITAPQKEAWPAAIRDLSTGGVGIFVKRRFELGTLLTIDLEDAARTTSRSLLVKVVRIASEQADGWLLGCAFVHKMSEADLLDLM